MTEDHETEIVRWYTRARRFPQLIGRTPDGMKIPFGPYTITQALGAGVVLFVGTKTVSLWAHFGFVGNAFIGVVATVATVWGLGRIPLGARNPISVVAGLGKALFAPRTGRVGGRPVRPRRPHRVRHSVVLALDLAQPGPTEVKGKDHRSDLLARTHQGGSAPALQYAGLHAGPSNFELAGVSAALANHAQTLSTPMEMNR